MEIDITSFVTTSELADFSASAAELGANAGRITWANAKREAEHAPLLVTDKALCALKRWAKDTGAWNATERAAWTADDCNALFIQLVSGDMREIENLCMDDDGEIDWTIAEEMQNEGRISGAVYRGNDGHIYYMLEG